MFLCYKINSQKKAQSQYNWKHSVYCLRFEIVRILLSNLICDEYKQSRNVSNRQNVFNCIGSAFHWELFADSVVLLWSYIIKFWRKTKFYVQL